MGTTVPSSLRIMACAPHSGHFLPAITLLGVAMPGSSGAAGRCGVLTAAVSLAWLRRAMMFCSAKAMAATSESCHIGTWVPSGFW